MELNNHTAVLDEYMLKSNDMAANAANANMSIQPSQQVFNTNYTSNVIRQSSPRMMQDVRWRSTGIVSPSNVVNGAGNLQQLSSKNGVLVLKRTGNCNVPTRFIAPRLSSGNFIRAQMIKVAAPSSERSQMCEVIQGNTSAECSPMRLIPANATIIAAKNAVIPQPPGYVQVIKGTQPITNNYATLIQTPEHPSNSQCSVRLEPKNIITAIPGSSYSAENSATNSFEVRNSCVQLTPAPCRESSVAHQNANYVDNSVILQSSTGVYQLRTNSNSAPNIQTPLQSPNQPVLVVNPHVISNAPHAVTQNQCATFVSSGNANISSQIASNQMATTVTMPVQYLPKSVIVSSPKMVSPGTTHLVANANLDSSQFAMQPAQSVTSPMISPVLSSNIVMSQPNSYTPAVNSVQLSTDNSIHSNYSKGILNRSVIVQNANVQPNVVNQFNSQQSVISGHSSIKQVSHETVVTTNPNTVDDQFIGFTNTGQMVWIKKSTAAPLISSPTIVQSPSTNIVDVRPIASSNLQCSRETTFSQPVVGTKTASGGSINLPNQTIINSLNKPLNVISTINSMTHVTNTFTQNCNSSPSLQAAVCLPQSSCQTNSGTRVVQRNDQINVLAPTNAFTGTPQTNKPCLNAAVVSNTALINQQYSTISTQPIDGQHNNVVYNNSCSINVPQIQVSCPSNVNASFHGNVNIRNANCSLKEKVRTQNTQQQIIAGNNSMLVTASSNMPNTVSTMTASIPPDSETIGPAEANSAVLSNNVYSQNVDNSVVSLDEQLHHNTQDQTELDAKEGLAFKNNYSSQVEFDKTTDNFETNDDSSHFQNDLSSKIDQITASLDHEVSEVDRNIELSTASSALPVDVNDLNTYNDKQSITSASGLGSISTTQLDFPSENESVSKVPNDFVSEAQSNSLSETQNHSPVCIDSKFVKKSEKDSGSEKNISELNYDLNSHCDNSIYGTTEHPNHESTSINVSALEDDASEAAFRQDGHYDISDYTADNVLPLTGESANEDTSEVLEECVREEKDGHIREIGTAPDDRTDFDEGWCTETGDRANDLDSQPPTGIPSTDDADGRCAANFNARCDTSSDSLTDSERTHCLTTTEADISFTKTNCIEGNSAENDDEFSSKFYVGSIATDYAPADDESLSDSDRGQDKDVSNIRYGVTSSPSNDSFASYELSKSACESSEAKDETLVSTGSLEYSIQHSTLDIPHEISTSLEIDANDSNNIINLQGINEEVEGTTETSITGQAEEPQQNSPGHDENDPYNFDGFDMKDLNLGRKLYRNFKNDQVKKFKSSKASQQEKKSKGLCNLHSTPVDFKTKSNKSNKKSAKRTQISCNKTQTNIQVNKNMPSNITSESSTKNDCYDFDEAEDENSETVSNPLKFSRPCNNNKAKINCKSPCYASSYAAGDKSPGYVASERSSPLHSLEKTSCTNLQSTSEVRPVEDEAAVKLKPFKIKISKIGKKSDTHEISAVSDNQPVENTDSTIDTSEHSTTTVVQESVFTPDTDEAAGGVLLQDSGTSIPTQCAAGIDAPSNANTPVIITAASATHSKSAPLPNPNVYNPAFIYNKPSPKSKKPKSTYGKDGYILTGIGIQEKKLRKPTKLQIQKWQRMFEKYKPIFGLKNCCVRVAKLNKTQMLQLLQECDLNADKMTIQRLCDQLEGKKTKQRPNMRRNPATKMRIDSFIQGKFLMIIFLLYI